MWGTRINMKQLYTRQQYSNHFQLGTTYLIKSSELHIKFTDTAIWDHSICNHAYINRTLIQKRENPKYSCCDLPRYSGHSFAPNKSFSSLGRTLHSVIVSIDLFDKSRSSSTLARLFLSAVLTFSSLGWKWERGALFFFN